MAYRLYTCMDKKSTVNLQNYGCPKYPYDHFIILLEMIILVVILYLFRIYCRTKLLELTTNTVQVTSLQSGDKKGVEAKNEKSINTSKKNTKRRKVFFVVKFFDEQILS